MKIVGLTGGIGSGKSTVAKIFETLGIPVYIADTEAKRLMHTPQLKTQIIKLLGEAAYQENKLNRNYVSTQVFDDPDLLTKLNAIVHPAVKSDFRHWANKQHAPYVIKESAILFETGGDRECDLTILVTAPERERIRRVIQRDGTTAEEVLKRINKQWPDARKKELATFVLQNQNLQNTIKKVRKIHVNALRTLVNR
ncbi:MAG: dephospho-CoA kinase [Leeuwenhoekiella sp.]